MHSITTWNFARRPNYITNVDNKYPYSEVPYIGNYNLVKIPADSIADDLIQHVDYWGEGRIVTKEGSSGYPDCYNVNHQYQLVSNGPDRDRKIPNRIPVVNYTNCDTSSYIKDNSVKFVTVMGAPINKSCATDIARMVNEENGKVLIFGFEDQSAYVSNLEEALDKKKLVYCNNYNLPDIHKEVSLFANDNRVYLNITDLTGHIIESVNKGSFDTAVYIIKTLHSKDYGTVIANVIKKLLVEGNKNSMAFAYKLWNEGEKDVITIYFPLSFKQILKGDFVKIVDSKFALSIRLDEAVDPENHRLAWVDRKDYTSEKVRWIIVSLWEDNNVYFKIKNTHFNMLLTLDSTNTEDKVAKGAVETNDTKFQWIIEPFKVDSVPFYTMKYFIINRQFKQGLKPIADVDSFGNRQVLGHSGSVYENPEENGWYFFAWDSPQNSN